MLINHHKKRFFTEQAERSIIHMDLDSFFVSVECLMNSELRGIPLIIGGNGNRGVVASCSYEARKFGVHSAMPTKMALQLCPDAKVISGDMESYSKYSRLVTEVIKEESPTFEKASIDEFYIDATGMDISLELSNGQKSSDKRSYKILVYLFLWVFLLIRWFPKLPLVNINQMEKG